MDPNVNVVGTVSEEYVKLPDEAFMRHSNYPSLFNNETTIHLQARQATRVELYVFDV